MRFCKTTTTTKKKSLILCFLSMWWFIIKYLLTTLRVSYKLHRCVFHFFPPPSSERAYGLYQGGVEFDRNCSGRLSICAVGGNLFLPPPHSQGAWRRKLRCRFDLAGRIVETTISMYLTKPSFYDPTQLYLYFRVSLGWPCLREHSVLR